MNAETKVKAKAENSNLRIWDELAKTDPAHTKGFQRAGGFSGTAVKPIWIIKRLTEQFGPCGTGWGIGEPKFETVIGAPGEMLVYCTVSCWHSSPENVLWGVGGDRVAAMRKSGTPFFDDEAFKKAFTDAIGNAFKFLGVSADIHMGLFDDNKYVDAMRAEFEEPKREKVPGIAKIKERLNKLMTAGNTATSLEAFNALVHDCKAELTAIKEATHDYWTGDGADSEGFKAWIVRRRAELSEPKSENYVLCMETLDEVTNLKELEGWFKLNWKYVEGLDGAERDRVEVRYQELEAGLKQLDVVTN
jgi:hypothetical protein